MLHFWEVRTCRTSLFVLIFDIFLARCLKNDVFVCLAFLHVVVGMCRLHGQFLCLCLLFGQLRWSALILHGSRTICFGNGLILVISANPETLNPQIFVSLVRQKKRAAFLPGRRPDARSCSSASFQTSTGTCAWKPVPSWNKFLVGTGGLKPASQLILRIFGSFDFYGHQQDVMKQM